MEFARVEMPGAGVDLRGIEGAPEEVASLPLLMIHENRGLQPYMMDVIVGLAEHGHHVVAPDLLSRVGGTERTRTEPDLTTRAIPTATHEADLLAVFDWMLSRFGAVGLVGFCFGAEMGWRITTHRTPERAALLYGVGPEPQRVRDIRCSVYAAYAEDDDRVNRTLPLLLDSLWNAEIDVVVESWPGTQHAFHDHTRSERHHPQAARAVWSRLLAFLGS